MIEHSWIEDPVIFGELRLFRTLWHTSNEHMFIVKKVSDEFIGEKVNDALLRTFSLKVEQIIDVPIREFLSEESYKRISQMYETCIKTKKPISYEESHILNGKKTYWHTTILSYKDEENNLTRIFGVSKNITELKVVNEKFEYEVDKRTKKLKKTLMKLEKISVTDKLTKLYNRHKLDKALDESIAYSKRYSTTFGLILLDIDNFKKINDTYGHHTGDKVLKEFASILNKSIRRSDILGRWGGEEFLIIVPNTSEELIMQFANILKTRIENHRFFQIKKLTSSFGLTLFKEVDTAEKLIIRTDEALYIAKASGKNKVVIK